LWYLADSLGILNNVLNVLAKSVAVSSEETVATTTSTVQKKRSRTIFLEEETKRARQRDRRTDSFQRNIGTSLTALAISAKEEHLFRLQNRLTDYKLQAMEAEESDGPIGKKMFYESMIKATEQNIQRTLNEIDAMKNPSSGSSSEDDED
jgi:hypothetical protein